MRAPDRSENVVRLGLGPGRTSLGSRSHRRVAPFALSTPCEGRYGAAGEPTLTRIGVFGWGVVAPGAKDIDTLATRLDEPESWLSRFDGFGPSNFLVGKPDFDFADYQGWISERFPPSRFRTLDKKFGTPSKYAIGAFVQALRQNEGIEQELQGLGSAAQVIIGIGTPDAPTYDRLSLNWHRAQRRWNRFWCRPERNAALAAHLNGSALDEQAPPDPSAVDENEVEEAEENWWAYWAARSGDLEAYLEKQREIEAVPIAADIATSKAVVIKNKRRDLKALQKEWGAPDAPWETIAADGLWNIPSSPASQISMLGKIRGMVFSPAAACSAFGYSLKLGMDAIRRGEARLAVIGAADPEPHPIAVGTFYNARVLANDGAVSKPLTGLKGTHLAGGAAVWIIGDLDYYRERGWKALGLEPLAVGVTADADHIITPSPEGPSQAIEEAIEMAGVDKSEVMEWDLHATGTPGDELEVRTIREILGHHTRLTARKGTFGHGLGVGGGWELTAQYLGHARGRVYPTPLSKEELHPAIAKANGNLTLKDGAEAEGRVVGKLSMGVGGLNAAVISRKY